MVLVGIVFCFMVVFFFFKQKTAYGMRISDWSSDVCSSDLGQERLHRLVGLVDVVGIPREGDPAERAEPTTEKGTDIGWHKAGERERVLDTFFLGYLADIVAIVDHWNAHAPPVEHGRDVGRDRKIGRATCRERVCQ